MKNRKDKSLLLIKLLSVTFILFCLFVNVTQGQEKSYYSEYDKINRKNNNHKTGESLKRAAEKIFFYSKGYYTRWEAETDKISDTLKTGFKHTIRKGRYVYGKVEKYKGASTWATDSSLGFRVDSLLWGPNYRQDKNYSTDFSNDRVIYTASYRMALNYEPTGYSPEDTVCALYIIHRYKEKTGTSVKVKTDTLRKKYITLKQFPVPGKFYRIYARYCYPLEYGNKEKEDNIVIEDEPKTGIEFQLSWYGIGKLYIDYVDLYDNMIGFEFIYGFNLIKENLISYANSFSNLKDIVAYWYKNNKPTSIDSYTPIETINSIIMNLPSLRKEKLTGLNPYKTENEQKGILRIKTGDKKKERER